MFSGSYGKHAFRSERSGKAIHTDRLYQHFPRLLCQIAGDLGKTYTEFALIRVKGTYAEGALRAIRTK